MSYVDLGLWPKIKGAAKYFSTCITQPESTLEIHRYPASRFLPLHPQHGNEVGLGIVIIVCCSGGTLCYIFIYQALQ